jgi:ferric-dicitrate binding protein FerR (iron transport regulator)
LVFHQTPLPEVLATLARWYGYAFRVDDSTLAAQRVTIGLSTRSSSETLATLKLLLDVDLTIDHNEITLRPRQGTTRESAPKNIRRELSPLHQEMGR